MNADQWTNVWILILAGGCGGFAVLALVVAIGGFRDVRAMFRRIDAEHADRNQQTAATEASSAANDTRR